MDNVTTLRFIQATKATENCPEGLLCLYPADSIPPDGWRECTKVENDAYFGVQKYIGEDEDMISSEEIKAAYNLMAATKEKLYQAEEDRITATIQREEKFMAAINEAIADGITDPGRQQQKAMRATREQLTWQHVAEKASRKAQHEYQCAGMAVDSLVRQMEAEKLARQTD